MSKELDAKKKEKITLINDVKTAKKELVKFRKTNNIKAGEQPEDEKLLKTFKKLVAAIKTQETALEKVKAEVKELTPKKTGGFAAKYDYPMVSEDGKDREMTAKEKKAFRIKARNAAKKGEAVPTEAKAKTETSKKKADAKASEKVAEAEPAKKAKKKKKATAASEDEDED